MLYTYPNYHADPSRELGDPSQSEFTVVKVEAYNGISSYLSQLSNTDIQSFEDIIHFNEENTGTEGAEPGDHPAFAAGQVSFSHSRRATLNVQRTSLGRLLNTRVLLIRPITTH